MPVLSKSFRPSKSTVYVVSGVAFVGAVALGIQYWRSRNRPYIPVNGTTDRGLSIFYSTQKGQSKVCKPNYM